MLGSGREDWLVLGRGWVLWGLALVLAAVGGFAAVVQALGWAHWKWLAVTGAVLVPVVAVPAKAVVELVVARAKRAQDVRGVLVSGSVGGGRVRVREVDDPTVLGVHPASALDQDDAPADGGQVLARRVPVYVRRDQHPAVVARLAAGKFVLVLGDSAAGKSRVAFEALREAAARHVLFAPEPAAVGAAMEQMLRVRRAVLWLDDLDRFLEADTLTATAVTGLLSGSGHQRMVVATLRHRALDALLIAPEGVAESVAGRRQRILNLADRVLIRREFTTTELDRARQQRHDPRIAAALAHASTYGLAEYLAAGPQLLDKYLAGQESHPRGAALVAAALDCRHSGFITPIPRALLEQVHPQYLPSSPRARLEDLNTAWAWATELWGGATALLEPTTDDDTIIVFDYLLDHLQRTTPVDYAPPTQVLHTTLTHTDAPTATAMGGRAFRQGRYELAHAAYTRAHTLHTTTHGADHPDTLTSRGNLALVLGVLGRFEEAEREHRATLDSRTRILGADHPDTLTSRGNLAIVLRELGRLDEAEREHRATLDSQIRILGADHPDTLTSRGNLAIVLHALNRQTGPDIRLDE